jgi:asparagine synthase (glutamine-hydrolysing)
MCGICGLYSPTGEPPRALVDAMRAQIRHRGPDHGSSDALTGGVVLGHQRLRVIDLDTGDQPVANESGEVVAVFNGELYNFRALREELAAHAVRGSGDTPVIPHLYEEHGVRFVERLDGMFAVALWDAPRRRLVLARDRLGKKPLVWTRLDDGTLAFASELKSFTVLPEFRAEPDFVALDAYLALGYVPGDRTGLLGVRRVPPAHVLVVEADGEPQLERYWSPTDPSNSLLLGSEGDALDAVRAEVTAAVRKRLVADVPLGALLSGGIDSAIVVALMAEASPEPVRTFTVGFSDAAYDERRYARAVAERYATHHEEVVLEPDAAEVVPRLAEAFDEPLGDEAALPLYLICEAARRHVTVALCGDGGDESFAGYERYAAAELAARIPSPLASLGARLLDGAGEQRATRYRIARLLDVAAAPASERYGRMMQVFSPEQRRSLWADGVLSELPALPHPAELLGPPPARGSCGLQLLDLETYLPGDLLPKSDIASMAHSLELRSPFLDHRVVELGLALPESLRLRGRTGKVALRRAFADRLPPEVAGRGKRGFGVPLARWFRGDLRELAHDVLLDSELLRPTGVRALLDEHEARRADHGHRLWTLLMLELWRRRFAGAIAAAPVGTATG